MFPEREIAEPVEPKEEVKPVAPVETPEEFTAPAEWQAQTAGENKVNPRLYKHRKIDELANYTLSLEDKISKIPKDAAYVPGENATDEEKTAFYKALGVPEAIDAYKKVDTGLDPRVDLTEGELARLAKVAFEKKFQPEQFEAVQQWYADSVKERTTEINEQKKVNTQKKTEEYKEKWGEDYKVKYDAMTKAVEHFGGDEFKGYLNETGLGNFPKVVEFLVEKGLSLQDPALLEGGIGGKKKENPGYMQYESMKDLR
ncbi:MAG: hypothetical protein PF638_11195 [Candidatus Delongbacteria bacterium]|jgi:hypothetical protein|nr:hypothetical protein [Candidatus Delongbacteria bacterium]